MGGPLETQLENQTLSVWFMILNATSSQQVLIKCPLWTQTMLSTASWSLIFLAIALRHLLGLIDCHLKPSQHLLGRGWNKGSSAQGNSNFSLYRDYFISYMFSRKLEGDEVPYKY